MMLQNYTIYNLFFCYKYQHVFVTSCYVQSIFLCVNLMSYFMIEKMALWSWIKHMFVMKTVEVIIVGWHLNTWTNVRY